MHLLIVFHLALVPGVQNWYVDATTSDCTAGTGTPTAPFCTIQEAVIAAQDGDAIFIAPGTYFENVVLDKNLVLIGTGGRADTIVDGMASGSVIRIVDTGATLVGLTLTNGTGTMQGADSSGGGLFIHSPMDLGQPVDLVHCSVIANHSDLGGGIANGALATVPGGTLTLTDTTVAGNRGDGVGGGGIATFGISALELNGCQVRNNTGRCNGGGILSFGTGPVNVNDSMIFRNQTYGECGGGGGGIFAIGFVTLIDSEVFWNYTGPSESGGGVLCRDLCLEGSTIRSNYSGLGGGIRVESTLTAANTRITDNGGQAGGGIFADRAHVVLRNTTIAGNEATGSDGGGGVALYMGHVDIANTILWNNLPDSIAAPPDSSAAVSYSVVQGAWPGSGNLDSDPRFVGHSDYRLVSGSPCIDAGDNTSVSVGTMNDIRGLPRFVDDPLTQDTGVGIPTVDMGAYELQPPGPAPVLRHKRRGPNVPVPLAPTRRIP